MKIKSPKINKKPNTDRESHTEHDSGLVSSNESKLDQSIEIQGTKLDQSTDQEVIQVQEEGTTTAEVQKERPELDKVGNDQDLNENKENAILNRLNEGKQTGQETDDPGKGRGREESKENVENLKDCKDVNENKHVSKFGLTPLK